MEQIKWDENKIQLNLNSAIKQTVEVDFGIGVQLNDIRIIGAKYKVSGKKIILFLPQKKNVELTIGNL